MATKTIERSFPGRGADEIYAAVEALVRKMAAKLSLECAYDPAARHITARGPLGISADCRVEDGHARLDLTHGLTGALVAGQARSIIEEKLDGLFR